MIVSASRRTDIPALYANWFFNRVKEGYVHARNPVNRREYRVSLSPDDVTGVVFWTKNPAPMLNRLGLLSDYEYYFQFTLTPYDKDIEPNLPDKNELIKTFKRLSDHIGPDRIILRYDPILMNKNYHFEFHLRAFEKITDELCGYTHKVTISFIDENYRGVKANLKSLDLTEITDEKKIELTRRFYEIASKSGLIIDSCAGKLDLTQAGIGPACCVDASYFRRARDNASFKKDMNQRPGCGCAKSVDIGAYNTCVNGCKYCYANYIPSIAAENHTRHDPSAAGLIASRGGCTGGF